MTDTGVEQHESPDASERVATTSSLRDRSRIWLTQRRVACLIAVAQGTWLAVLLGRGWFSDADLARLADATGRRLGWAYLSDAAGGHYAPADRLVFWIMNRTAGIDWAATVVVRVLLAVGATLLLRHLLVILVGPRAWLNAVVACYAFSTLLLPGLAWLTSAMSLACAQVLILLTLIAHVRYTRSGRLVPGIAVGLCQALALGFQDQAILTLPVLVLLSLGFLHDGSFLARVRSSARRWLGWTAVLVFVGAFAVIYESGSYNRGSSSYGLSSAIRIIWQEWTDVLASALVAGPWRWWWNPTSYVAFANPTAILVLAGQLAFLALFVLSFRSTGRRAVLAWLIPVTVTCGGAALAGFGRYDVTNTFIAPVYRYSFTAGVALAVGVTLAFARQPQDQAATHTASLRSAQRALVLVVPLFLLGSAISSLGFDQRFARNPAKGYVDNLLASARAVGPKGNVFDSAVSHAVLPFAESHHYVSDILRLAGVRVTYNQTSTQALVVGADGRLGPSAFVRQADAMGQGQPNCGTHLGGVGTWTIPLSQALPLQDWFLNLQTYQARPAVLSVSVVDAGGNALRPVGGGRVVLADQVDSIMLRLPVSAPKALIVRSTSAATTVCLVHSYVGNPFPKPDQ